MSSMSCSTTWLGDIHRLPGTTPRARHGGPKQSVRPRHKAVGTVNRSLRGAVLGDRSPLATATFGEGRGAGGDQRRMSTAPFVEPTCGIVPIGGGRRVNRTGCSGQLQPPPVFRRA